MANGQSRRRTKLNLLLCGLALGIFGFGAAQAQVPGLAIKSDKELKLAKDSPFRDPDIIYLEADELENDQINGILTASGQVEGRYQDRTLRADKVIYSTKSGRVIAVGNVVLVNADGSSQYADKLELSDELEAGTAANFTARFPQGGQLSSAFAARTTDEGIELYNAYYTACEACKVDGKTKKPTWRLKARKVTQNKDTKSIQYRDAVFEFKGIPFFYTPYLAHPDPSLDRASGWLIPFGGLSGSKGVNFRTPYYFALSPYSELTLTPRVYSKVNPVLQANYRKKFYSGEINLEGSVTYASFFDNHGDTFTDQDVFANPEESLKGKKWRSHLFSNGQFNLSDQWKWGFELNYATDDNYIDRYDFRENRPKFGLYQADTRRLMEQLYVVGQGENFRFSTSAFANVSLRSSVRRHPNDYNLILVGRENDSTLPVVAPKIELTKYFDDGIVGGRFKVFGDATFLTREIGTDYIRASGGLDWRKNIITPMGIEVKPFAMTRFDHFKLEPEGEKAFDFNRTIGQVGVDMRWPFLRAGETVDWIIEPRVQITQSFGDGKLANFQFNNGTTALNLQQDGLDIDFDHALLWNANKSTGYDIWQEGFRADVGASLIANWGRANRAMLFLGQSYYDGNDNIFALASGLSEDKSDLVGVFELGIGRFRSTTRVRYDEDDSKFRRLDTSFAYSDKRIQTNLRY
ncbi:MAG TPA: LPS-assembly protein LptD, partial [Hellea balneolensis]|nr:LPS-assembly protein LptD [Hellea balneolensis]